MEHEQLKAQSQEEIRQLWSQLDGTRANRQELSGMFKTDTFYFFLFFIQEYTLLTQNSFNCVPKTYRKAAGSVGC